MGSTLVHLVYGFKKSLGLLVFFSHVFIVWHASYLFFTQRQWHFTHPNACGYENYERFPLRSLFSLQGSKKVKQRNSFVPCNF